MKQFLTVGFLILFITNISGQVRIGMTPGSPVASAVLELDGGTDRGLLLPRMRKMDMLAIVNPAEGLIIYTTDEQSIYLRNAGTWIKINGTGNTFELPYTGIFNEGILPVLSLSNSTNGGVGIYGASTIGAGTGVHGYAFNGNGYGIRGTGIFGRGGYFNSRNSHALVTDSGRVGFGILNPTAFVEIDGTKSDAASTMIINDDDDPLIQFRRAGINKSYIKQQGNDLILRPNDQNFTGKVILQAYNQGGWMFVDANGNSSFGQDPSTFNGTPDDVRVHIRSNSEDVLTLDAPVGSFGPKLAFIDKTGNSINHLGSIQTSNNSMTFNHKAKAYEWYGSGGDVIMKLSDTDPIPLEPAYLKVNGWLGVGQFSPSAIEATLQVTDVLGYQNTMIINSQSAPLINFQSNNVEKGFIQQIGNDMKIGTFATNDLGSFVVRTNGSDRLFVRADGKMVMGSGGGTAPAGTHLMAIKGKIAATEFDVVNVGSWPDYVFEPGYKLKPLEEVESFIKEHRHLPNIPAAAMVEKQGYGLGDMQKRMMEKIEELTLYLIDAKKEINELKQQVELLQAKK